MYRANRLRLSDQVGRVEENAQTTTYLKSMDRTKKGGAILLEVEENDSSLSSADLEISSMHEGKRRSQREHAIEN